MSIVQSVRNFDATNQIRLSSSAAAQQVPREILLGPISARLATLRFVNGFGLKTSFSNFSLLLSSSSCILHAFVTHDKILLSLKTALF